ncbi:MAG: septum formation inhibitor Maf [Thiomicrospira sp.]|nr:MAG: septum formation inhibitor Maf [Thiomicrospira sp.]
MKRRLYLSSSSPRRKELLDQAGIPFDLVNAPVEETGLPNESPQSFVLRMAVEKALSGFNKVPGKDVWVLGSDTIILKDGKVFGKPKHKMDAYRMLMSFSSEAHIVMTSIAIVNDGAVYSDICQTKVFFRPISDSEFEQYWATGEAEDKAGAYGIQGQAAKFIEKIEGSYSAVMGLPLYELDKLLKESNFYSE